MLFLVREKKRERHPDSILLFLVLLLTVCGLVFLYSTSAYNGRVKFHDSAYYFKKQIFATSLGLMGMYLVSCMDYHILVKFAPFFIWYPYCFPWLSCCSEMSIMVQNDGCP